MIEYKANKNNILNVKLSKPQLNKLKSVKKRVSGNLVTLNLSSNVVGESNVETNFPHKLLLTDTQVSRICKAFANGSSANIKFSYKDGLVRRISWWTS